MDKSTCELKRGIHHLDGLVLSTLTRPMIDPIGYFDAAFTDPTLREDGTRHTRAQAGLGLSSDNSLRSSRRCRYLHQLSPKSQRFLSWCCWQGLRMQYDLGASQRFMIQLLLHHHLTPRSYHRRPLRQ